MSTLPLGVAVGTVRAVTRLLSSTCITITCDDVRWLGHETRLYVPQRSSARLHAITDVLQASRHDLSSLVGKQGRFVYNLCDVGPSAYIVWGMPRGCLSPEFAEYAKTLTLAQKQEIANSPGVLPYSPETITTGLYR